MMKILLVTYTPREESNTAKLVQAYIDEVGDKQNITHLDLVKTPAPLLLEENLNALIKRNFMGMALSEGERSAVESADLLVQQLLAADRIVLAFPMYNLSLPATVKAWFDAIIQIGKTFTIGESGYQGLCQGKKALILMTCGGDFTEEPMVSMNHATPLAESLMGFMGIESESIIAHGLNQYVDRVEQIVSQAQQNVVAYIHQNT
ncbi:NAD(P)H-dependent oxidoreductase [Marinomonas sp. C2222]|uniref:FMN dependent NADH:quinone oxidoreductase n=1 Tax=Marinomonas sargassi TaxID=2984494 RepID=A0ABT2YTH8_9GAMM|nr:NAD(P)H-dependent oxidoreductase [Marinomonas sargassi]MCV2403197.1 NAD(P)H-dependent oxidoreductase [Marinomonas sargassi]